MPTGKRNFGATITTRYGLPEKSIYEQVIDLVKKNNLSRSRTQLLLVKRGLQHTQNPEPLVKEKVVYKDKIVYRDPPKVDKSTPHIQEHITDEQIGESHHNTGERASATKLTTRDRADSPSSPDTALGEKKVAKEDSGLGWLVVGIAGIVGLTYWLIKSLPGSLPPR